MKWDGLFASRMGHMKRSTIREILKLTAQPDVISFAGGLPAPELFPTERVEEATSTALAERGQEALQYSTTEGMPELRELIAQRMSDGDLQIGPDNIVLVSGSQQALDLVCRVFLDEDDAMVIENPSYLGMLMAARPYGVRFVPIRTDQDGVVVDDLEPLLEENPKMVYVVPDFQNPQGTTLSLERRRQLVEATSGRPLVIVEDNPYGELRYSGEAHPPLLHLEARHRGSTAVDGNVVYISTFSKTLAPGMRLGWIVAHEEIIDKIVQAKQSADLHTSTFAQFVTYETARDSFLDEHVARLREVYRQRRDIMLEAMGEYFPPEVRWQKPDGGLFLMVYMPEHIDSHELLKKALERKVAFVPGTDFHLDGSGRNTFRLNFSNARPEMITEGIRRLGELLQEEVRRE